MGYKKNDLNEEGFKVKRRDNESFQQMLNRFSKKAKKFGFWDDIKKNKYYTKPTKRRREAKKRGIINAKIAKRKRGK